jgi:hypothetical protein
LKNLGVRNGSTIKITTLTTTKISVFIVKGEKIRPNAMTVPRSLIKQAARIAFPNSVTLKPNSSMTAYTTATEVVESATPASQLDFTVQWSM